MKCKAIKTFHHDQLGTVVKGQEFEATEAQLFAVRRAVEVYETKVIHEAPSNANSIRDKAASGARPDGRKQK